MNALPDPHLTAVGAYAGALHHAGWHPVDALRAAAQALPRPRQTPVTRLWATGQPGRYVWTTQPFTERTPA